MRSNERDNIRSKGQMRGSNGGININVNERKRGERQKNHRKKYSRNFEI